MLLTPYQQPAMLLISRETMRKRRKYYRYKDSHRTVRGVKQKRCNMCKKWKQESESDFYRHPNTRDGLLSICKVCTREHDRKRYEKNRKPGKRLLRYEDRHRIHNGNRQKLCSCCRRWKNEEDFYRNQASQDGLTRNCKKCSREYNRRFYQRNRKPGRQNLQYEDRHKVVGGVKQKLCSHCDEWKAKADYYRKRGTRDGLGLICKTCMNEYSRKYRERNRRTGKRLLRYEDRHRTIGGVKQKLCSRCEEWKSETDFHNNKNSKDGLAWPCKECTREYGLKRYEEIGKSVKSNLRYEDSHRVVDGVKQKMCYRCKEWKAESYFRKNRRTHDGLTRVCKTCKGKDDRKYREKYGKTGKRLLKYEEHHRTINGVKYKLCNRCKTWKNETDFHSDRNSNDGLVRVCKECTREYGRKRYEQIVGKSAKSHLRYEDRHRIIDDVRQKLCGRCNEWKDEIDFSKDRTRKDGLNYYCKRCLSKTDS